jgi:hypothetical protein
MEIIGKLFTLASAQKTYIEKLFAPTIYAFQATSLCVDETTGEAYHSGYVKVGMSFHAYQVIRRYITSFSKNTACLVWDFTGDKQFASLLAVYLQNTKCTASRKALSQYVEDTYEIPAHNALIAQGYSKESEKFSHKGQIDPNELFKVQAILNNLFSK